MTSKEHRGNLFLAITLLAVIGSVVNAQRRFVTIRGKDFISPDNKPFLLKGIKDLRKARPTKETIEKALSGYLEQTKIHEL